MKYPTQQFEKLIDGLEVLIKHTKLNIELIPPSLGLMHQLHYNVWQQMTWDGDNMHAVIQINGNRLLPLDKTFELYPAGINDDHITTAMKQALSIVRDRLLKSELHNTNMKIVNIERIKETIAKCKGAHRWDKCSYGYAIGAMDPRNTKSIYWDSFKKDELVEEFYRLIPDRFDRIKDFTTFKNVDCYTEIN